MYNGANKIKIMVRQFFNRGKDDYVGDIEINLYNAQTDGVIDSLDVNQSSNHCEINSNKISKVLSARECNVSTIMNIII